MNLIEITTILGEFFLYFIIALYFVGIFTTIVFVWIFLAWDYYRSDYASVNKTVWLGMYIIVASMAWPAIQLVLLREAILDYKEDSDTNDSRETRYRKTRSPRRNSR